MVQTLEARPTIPSKFTFQADVIGCALQKGEVRKQLKGMPDLEDLLEYVQKNDTVKPFLEENGASCFPGQIRQYNSDFRNYLFGDKTNLQIRTLLRKVTFSRWLYQRRNWSGMTEDEIIGAVNRGAQLICSEHPGRRGAQRIYPMKGFLLTVIAREFADTKGDQEVVDAMFAPRNGRIIREDDIDPAASFGLFAKSCYFPEIFNELIGHHIEEKSRHHSAMETFKGVYNSRERKKRWVSAGLVFLENALALKSGQPTLEALTYDRRGELRKFREIFQTGLLRP